MRIPFLLLTLFASALATAQQGSIDVIVDEDTVAVGEVFDVTWSMDFVTEELDLPAFKDLELVSGPNRSSSMSIINGATTSFTKYTYRLKALEPGTYKLPVFRAKKKAEHDWLVSGDARIVAHGSTIGPSKSDRFMSMRPFPEGTTTIHFKDEVGYVATENGGTEVIEFQLSPEDVSMLRGILSGMRLKKN